MSDKNSESMRILLESAIGAPVQSVFPLACPVMEYKWIEGWKSELVHCPNGYVEKNCVFKEIMSAPFLMGSFYGKTTWTAVLYDPHTYKVHYRLENKISVSLYKIELEADGKDRTKCRLELTYDALNRKGISIIENQGAEKIRFMLSILSRMMKYYSEMGEILKSASLARQILRFKHFTPKDKTRLLLNNLLMKVMRDKDRKRFLAGLPVSRINEIGK
jgi:hypothetical protein